MVPDYCVRKCNKNQQADLAKTLHILGQLTWRELKRLDRLKNGFEKITRSSIRAGIPHAVTPDVNLLAFRFSDKAPMIGFRRGATFFIVWLDHQFKLYDHE